MVLKVRDITHLSHGEIVLVTSEGPPGVLRRCRTRMGGEAGEQTREIERIRSGGLRKSVDPDPRDPLCHPRTCVSTAVDTLALYLHRISELTLPFID